MHLGGTDRCTRSTRAVSCGDAPHARLRHAAATTLTTLTFFALAHAPLAAQTRGRCRRSSRRRASDTKADAGARLARADRTAGEARHRVPRRDARRRHHAPGRTARAARAAARAEAQVVLSMEMFERDVQPVLDDYLAGRIDEGEFLHKAAVGELPDRLPAAGRSREASEDPRSSPPSPARCAACSPTAAAARQRSAS
ncbi:MAG: ChaN family lipoprotein [Planctomycetota bacterium]